MNFDVSNGLVPFGSGTDVTPSAQAADPASAGSAASSGDAASGLPLAYFGDMIQQIGRSMTGDPAASASSDPNAHAQSMNDAIDMLEGVIGMMSLYGSPDEEIGRLQSGDLPQLDRISGGF